LKFCKKVAHLSCSVSENTDPGEEDMNLEKVQENKDDVLAHQVLHLSFKEKLTRAREQFIENHRHLSLGTDTNEMENNVALYHDILLDIDS
ncbi:unnamed protein product, partial [Amoebophrya sp. A120]